MCGHACECVRVHVHVRVWSGVGEGGEQGLSTDFHTKPECITRVGRGPTNLTVYSGSPSSAPGGDDSTTIANRVGCLPSVPGLCCFPRLVM
jgi:hypothetical protein